jgi:hypothetical protein
LKKVTIGFDHDPILFSAANPADEVFGRHTRQRGGFVLINCKELKVGKPAA